MPSSLGLVAYDLAGQLVGRIEATYPYDGSDPEFAVIHLAVGAMGRTRLVPFAGSARSDDGVQFAYTLAEIEDAPSPDADRWGAMQADRARAYW